MNNLNKQKTERVNARKSYQTAVDYARLMLDRTNVMKKFFQSVSSVSLPASKDLNAISKSFKMKIPRASEANPPVAPGLPGRTSSLYEYCMETISLVATEYFRFTDQISKIILPKLTEIIKNQEDIIEKSEMKFEKAASFIKTFKSQLSSAVASNGRSVQSIVKLHESIASPFTKSSHIPKLKSQIIAEYDNIVSTQALIFVHCSNLNQAHHHYLQVINSIAKDIKEAEICRIAQLSELIAFASTDSEAASSNIGQFVQIFVFDDSLGKDFASFIQGWVIAKTDMRPIYPKERKLDFDEPSFPIFVEPRQLPTKPSPLYFADAVKDFKGEKATELSVGKGQRVLVYDGWKQDWVRASVVGDDTVGFLPRSALMIDHRSTAIVLNTEINEGEMLSLSYGDVVILMEDRGGGIVLCQDWRGKVGLFRAENLLIEKDPKE